MNYNDKIFVSGHRGLEEAAIVRLLREIGFNNFIMRTHQELVLTIQSKVQDFFDMTKPDGEARKLIDINKLKNVGCKSKVGLKDGIENTHNWYRSKKC